MLPKIRSWSKIAIQKESRRPGLRLGPAHALLDYGPARTPTETEPLNQTYPVSSTGRDDRSTGQPPTLVTAIDAPPLRDEPPDFRASQADTSGLACHRRIYGYVRSLTATVMTAIPAITYASRRDFAAHWPIRSRSAIRPEP